MVQMVRSSPSRFAGEVEFVNVDNNKSDLMVTTMLVVSGKYGIENPEIKGHQCQEVGHY